MGSETIKIRSLKRKDRVILSGLIKKLADRIGSSNLLNIIKSGVKQGQTVEGESKFDAAELQSVYIELGVEILKLLIETLESDISEWFADLIGVSVEEFNELPLDVEIQIVGQIVEAKEANDFFTGALQLFNLTKRLARQFPSKKK